MTKLISTYNVILNSKEGFKTLFTTEVKDMALLVYKMNEALSSINNGESVSIEKLNNIHNYPSIKTVYKKSERLLWISNKGIIREYKFNPPPINK